MNIDGENGAVDGTFSDREYNEQLGGKWSIPEEFIHKSPSVVRGMSFAQETEHRRRGVRFIKYMMRYLTFEKIIQGSTIDLTKTPRVFPTAVHMFHRFYTVHPFQYFNEYVTAIACVFQATKIEEHVLPIAKILELAKVNSRSLTWVKIPKELSFENNDWMTLWKNEVIETEFLLFTTVNPMRFLFPNIYGWILQYVRSWVGHSIKEEVGVTIRDKAFTIASDVYSCGSLLVVTESTRAVAAMCLTMVLKRLNITVKNASEKTEGHPWYFIPGEDSSLEKLKAMESEFLAHLKQYNSVKAIDDKSKPKGVSPSSDYGSEGSMASNPVSPSDSMCSDRDILSNGPTSPAESTASSSDHGVSLEGRDHFMKRPAPSLSKRDLANLAPPCQVVLSVRKEIPATSTSSTSYLNQGRKSEVPMKSPYEPVQKKMKVHSQIHYP